eukprot:Partr_v1_DN28139_c3_g1_i2_m55249 putative mitogen-activated protein kinase kinase kinase
MVHSEYQDGIEIPPTVEESGENLPAILGWTTEQVSAWLCANGLGKFAKHFIANDISGEVLFELDHGHLKDMSIRTVGDRAKILLAIRRLLRSNSPPSAISSSTIASSSTSRPSIRSRRISSSGSVSATASDYHSLNAVSAPSSPTSAFMSPFFRPHSKRPVDKSLQPMTIITSASSTPTSNFSGQHEAEFITDLEHSEPASPSASSNSHNIFFSPRISSFFENFRRGSPSQLGTKFRPFASSSQSAATCAVTSPEAIDIMSFESVRKSCIRVHADNNTSHVINTSDLVDGAQVMQKIFDKFSYDSYNPRECTLLAVEDCGAVELLTEEKLWRICSKLPPHELKDKLWLKKLECGVQEHDPTRPATGLSPSLIDERPSSDVISVHLDVFFPAIDTMGRKKSSAGQSATSPTSRKSIQALVQQRTKKLSIGLDRPPRSPLRTCMPKSPLRSSISPRSNFVPNDQEPVEYFGENEIGYFVADEVEEDELLGGCPLYQTLATLLPIGENESVGLKNWIKGDIIGRGSFASVYYGINPATGDIMAVKQVDIPNSPSALENRTKFIQSLTHEIDLLKTMEHENIVMYHGSFCDGNYLNVFLEYVDGGSVDQLLRNVKRLSIEETVELTRQTLCGLSYLHSKNIVHRDIKSGNILITSDRKVKISDFGVSKILDGVTKRFSVQGSIFWMAPELIRSQSCSCKADIWSVGCLVLEMLTGEHPWSGYDQVQAMYQIGMGAMTPLDHYFSPSRSRSQSIDSPAGSRPLSSILGSSYDQSFTPFSRQSFFSDVHSPAASIMEKAYISPQARSFMELCMLADPESRPAALDLLENSFLQ